ncbi:MAG: sigma-70 family RNA polymerase sigma factor [Thermoanaerobaculia bacterium]
MELAWTASMALQTAAPTESEESRLIARSRNGDSEAFGQLVWRHQRRVFRLAGRFFRQPQEVEDAAQETFLAAWRKLDTYRAEAPFEHWLTRICLNCCYARLRKRRRHEEAIEREPAAPQPDPDARLEVERLLGRLSSQDRFMLLLLYGEGWSVAQVAERLGWSPVNVKVRAHRARRRLRRLMEEEPSS